MDTGQARKLFRDFSAATMFVSVMKPSGDLGIGTAVHVGDGIFVTARHVVDGNNIVEVGCPEDLSVPAAPGAPPRPIEIKNGKRQIPGAIRNRNLTVVGEPRYHRNPEVDLAAFRVEGLAPSTPWVPLGGYFDGWLDVSDRVMEEGVVMGYPQVPCATSTSIIASRVEVSGFIHAFNSPGSVLYVLSAMARGAYSGAMVIDSDGEGLGVVIDSLHLEDQPKELGFMVAISIEPVYELLADHELVPTCQAARWDDFHASNLLLGKPQRGPGGIV